MILRKPRSPLATAPKDGHTRGENVATQPLRAHRVFNNPDVVTEAWYPVCPSADLPKGAVRSFKLTFQRVALFRGEDGAVRAVDAFCPHMGADLGNGCVVENDVQCYFHQFRFDGKGCLVQLGKRPAAAPARKLLRAYPVEEKYGFVWIFSGEVAPYPVPSPPGLDGEDVEAWHLGAPLLFAHHHVMMVGGIDLQHFASVHGLDVAFDLQVDARGPIADFRLEGTLPTRGVRARIGRALLGSRFGYDARFAGGSVVALTYGPHQRFRGEGRSLPPLYILWGGVAEESGVSRVHVFLLAKRRAGLLGRVRARALLGVTAALLAVLRDDDVKAFPHMRFNPGHLAAEDRSVATLIRFIEELPVSAWSKVRAARPA